MRSEEEWEHYLRPGPYIKRNCVTQVGSTLHNDYAADIDAVPIAKQPTPSHTIGGSYGDLLATAPLQ